MNLQVDTDYSCQFSSNPPGWPYNYYVNNNNYNMLVIYSITIILAMCSDKFKFKSVKSDRNNNSRFDFT